MTSVSVKGKNFSLTPKNFIGGGGEAAIYKYNTGLVLKVFKTADDDTYLGDPMAQTAAKARIQEHQTKLLSFPKNLPPTVISPVDLAYDNRTIVGYTMSFINDAELLLSYTDKSFRQNIDPNETLRIATSMHDTVKQLHGKGVIVGDFSAVNIMVPNDFSKDPVFIDADSYQFGNFKSTMFNAAHLDPLLCDPNNDSMVLWKPYDVNADWYAYTAILMELFLLTGPYGGVYRPKDKKDKISPSKRPLKRITVFHPDVIYPKPAMAIDVLPDDLLDYFHRAFEKDSRGEFPLKLIQNMRWTTCTNCGALHAKVSCPACSATAPGAVKQTIVINGNVVCNTVFTTSGVILYSTVQGGTPRFIYHENGAFKREDGTTVMSGPINKRMRFRINGRKTLVAQPGKLAIVDAATAETVAVDSFGNLPVFDANADNYYWVNSGHLYRNGSFGPEVIGDVMQNRTIFWVGEKFGFGFYQAGNLFVGFVFDAKHSGINDSIDLPPIKGQLIDQIAYFSKDLCWFMLSVLENGKTINRCYVINSKGEVIAQEEAEKDDDHWLGSIRGHFATSNWLFVPTNEGIIRMEAVPGSIFQAASFPDTEPFVDSGMHLFAASDGLYLTKRSKLQKMVIK
jgi:H/ACA ribonucleoprotein complex subunit 3